MKANHFRYARQEFGARQSTMTLLTDGSCDPISVARDFSHHTYIIIFIEYAYFSDGSSGTWRVRAAALSAPTVGATLKTERTTRGWRTTVAGGSRCGDNEWALSQSRATRLPLLPSTVSHTFPLIHPFTNSPTLLPWRTIMPLYWVVMSGASMSVIYNVNIFNLMYLNSICFQPRIPVRSGRIETAVAMKPTVRRANIMVDTDSIRLFPSRYNMNWPSQSWLHLI